MSRARRRWAALAAFLLLCAALLSASMRETSLPPDAGAPGEPSWSSEVVSVAAASDGGHGVRGSRALPATARHTATSTARAHVASGDGSPTFIPSPARDGAASTTSAEGPVASASPVSDERIEQLLHNTCEIPIELVWVDMEGEERSYGELSAGASIPLDTYRGHVWRLRVRGGERVRDLVAGSASLIEICDDGHQPSRAAMRGPRSASPAPGDLEASPRSVEAARVVIENDCEVPVEVVWVDFDGREQPWGLLARGESRTQDSYRGHLWRARSAHGEVGSTFLAAEGARWALCGGRARRRG